MGKASRHKRERPREERILARKKNRSYPAIERFWLFLRRNEVAVRSCAVFAVLVGVFVFVVSRVVETNALFTLLSFTARSTGSVLNVFGSDVHVDGSIIHSEEFSMNIVNECTAMIPMIILLCAVLAYPSGIKHKCLGLAIGLPILFLLNLIRVVSLFYIGIHFESFFETAHLLMWQPIMILAVIAIWLTWVQKVVYVRKV